MARVKSETLSAGEAKPSADPNVPESPQDAQASASDAAKGDAAPAEAKALPEPQAGAGKGDPNPPPPPEKTAIKFSPTEQVENEAEDEKDEPEEEGENAPVSGVTAEEIAAGQTKGRVKKAKAEPPPIPEGHQAVLSSPRPFGIWIDGKLHRFQKGRTPLTEEQHDACHLDSYVRDNGASVSYRPIRKSK